MDYREIINYIKELKDHSKNQETVDTLDKVLDSFNQSKNLKFKQEYLPFYHSYFLTNQAATFLECNSIEELDLAFEVILDRRLSQALGNFFILRLGMTVYLDGEDQGKLPFNEIERLKKLFLELMDEKIKENQSMAFIL